MQTYYKYPSFILYQAVKIFDSYIDTVDVSVNELQIVALAALWIALKKDLITDDIPEVLFFSKERRNNRNIKIYIFSSIGLNDDRARWYGLPRQQKTSNRVREKNFNVAQVRNLLRRTIFHAGFIHRPDRRGADVGCYQSAGTVLLRLLLGTYDFYCQTYLMYTHFFDEITDSIILLYYRLICRCWTTKCWTFRQCTWRRSAPRSLSD